ncbi:hypothetical protein [Bifidobacterium tissieri]|uniref:Uncharacterized protein n=1 Tax=Bifidobacterium tissieri TaxID=1630162 RepID=A0A5M9ZVE7_9BIFI|nr:hypothetical protein [Bifidobacterium tissieri]KAA8828664.1 hypothetical protein EM849_11545 [Bifidobacterium tissieri]KAA8831607.1 hypothetical protein EMO89_02460 [Bifidobacterium tissieri]
MSDDEPLIDWNDPVLWAWIRTYRAHTMHVKRDKTGRSGHTAVEGECSDCHRTLPLTFDGRCRSCRKKWRRHHDPELREHINRLQRENRKRRKQRNHHQTKHTDKEQE